MTLGEKIQQLRKRQGLSQETLAERLTVSRQAVSKWELGESVPDTENVVQLSKLFGVSADYLLRDEFESDTDIPAVRASAENLTAEYARRRHGTLRRAARCFLLLGAAGVLTFWILSSVIPARATVPDPIGPPVMADIIDGVPAAAPTDTQDGVTYWTTAEVRGDLGAFLTTYHFEGLFALCCACTLFGGVWLLVLLRRERRQQI
ncbi:MAG: helix-turn-helix domain-containing protein [Oscillospiraceae bacterium]|jgi:transcriptional regulator with XRE-family HTH domain|nr:helix-turn-helix domain-containing protein [Oscillospiraceae bacterium]